MSQSLTQRKKLTHPRPAAITFDERLWPMMAALLALAAMGAAAIAVTADFHDRRLWANGWTFLGSLAAVTVLLIWVVSRLSPSQRGLQLAAVLSLIFHILLCLSLNQQRLFARADARLALVTPPKLAEPFAAPDYHIRAPENPVEEHEKPVVAQPLEETPLELDEKQQLEPQPPANRPTPTAGEEPQVEPHLLPLRQPEEAAPRLAETGAEVSRAEPRAVELAAPQLVATPPAPLPDQAVSPPPADAAIARREQPLTTLRPTRLVEPTSQPEATPLDRPKASPPVPVHLPRSGAESDRPSERSQATPQISAPRIAELPREQLGTGQPRDVPQPLVKAPVRSGAGAGLPLELGTVREESRQNVVIGQFAAGLGKPARAAPADTAAASANNSANSAASALGKITAAPPLPAAGPIGAVAGTSGPSTAKSATSQPLDAPSGSARGKAAASLPIRIPAPEGAGGVAAGLSSELGTPSRLAREDSQVVPATARLLARASGGPLAIDGRTREPADAFLRRGGRMKNRGGTSGQPSEQTEAAIELGLVFLAKHQSADGSWNLHLISERDENLDPPLFRAETAATGLALLAFLGAGYDHYGGQYADVVQRAIDALVKHQKADGDLYRPEDAESNKSAHFYSHGIAAIALCEAYGMTGDKALAGPAQKAIDFIVATQDPLRGAWRYLPGNGSDTSVSGWQLMALKSGELAGLKIPPAAYEKAQRWLDRAQVGGSQYAYNPAASETPQQRHGRLPTAPMTAVGLLMRLYTGLNRQDAHLVEGAEYLLGRLPENGSPTRPARDTYYWYYATQVMFHMRGKYWSAWNDRLHPLLVKDQQPSGPLAGSWDPNRPVPDRWAPQGGRIYVTALNLLSLEVYYRHLPLYESTAR